MYKLGRLLSAIVSQNVSVLIVVGILRALFGVYGWFPDDGLHLLVGPMLNWLVPVLLGYTGGQLMGGKRGGVVAAIVLFALVLASSVSMIFIAMLVGPAIGWFVSRIDRLMENRLPSGFELLMSNFLHAAIAAALAVFSFAYFGQALSAWIREVNEGLIAVVNSGWLPAAAALIEPAKILFLNNVVNYGLMGPLGISQLHDLSKSIFFLLEANPGPAIGVLLAYVVKSRGKRKRHAGATLAIHALGGIQEVYFPYVLMRPVLLVPLIGGSMAGIWIFQFLDAGLVAMASPSSLLLIAALAPRDDLVPILTGIAASSAVSFVLSYVLVKALPEIPGETMGHRELNVVQRLQHVQQWDDLRAAPHPVREVRRSPGRPGAEKRANGAAESADRPASSPSPSSGQEGEAEAPSRAEDAGGGRESEPKRVPGTICFACDAGMGSSAMGAAMLRKKLKAAGWTDAVKVVHSSLDRIPPEADLIITHRYLLRRAMASAPGREYLALESYTNSPVYDEIVDRLRGRSSSFALEEKHVYLGCEAATLADALRQTAARLVRLGFAAEAALAGPDAGERTRAVRLDRSLGIGLAELRPGGGTNAAAASGAVVLQFPDGVPLDGGGRLYALIGIAGSGQPIFEWAAERPDAEQERSGEPEPPERLLATRSKRELLDGVRRMMAERAPFEEEPATANG
ncbi:PTS transporter subunit EIIC [Cohnella xylanilytica]|uniref:PTS system mannitol-specific EIICB component n=1 Tax=Cohnella xylanilytica TaxID=557555 RepID=A0A841TVS4_9BACL|nr:PTS transporter subunit EIIC [Cohnella xylanilytica]MBB6690283.1 PTS transporter subunit EIIC [Cohnella xylanilytica]